MEDHLKPEQMRDVLGHWREQDLTAVAHLLECELCRALVGSLAARPAEEEDGLAGGMAGLTSIPGVLELQAVTAWKLYEELMALEPEARRQAIQEPRFRNLFIAEVLLDESQRAVPAEPGRSEELARLAFALAGCTHRPDLEAWVDEVTARSCCLVGNARRLLGDGEEAERQLVLAARSLTGAPDSSVRAFYCELFAQLLEDQGHAEMAESLLWRAARIHRDLGNRAPQGECLCRLGFLFLKRNDLGQAASTLIRSWLLLSVDLSPVFAARSSLGLAVCLAALSQGEPAQRLLAESREVRQAIRDDPEEIVRLECLEARIEAHLSVFRCQ